MDCSLNALFGCTSKVCESYYGQSSRQRSLHRGHKRHMSAWWKFPVVGEVQGWRSGESTRLPPMWPGFDSRTRRPMWVEFVLVLFSAPRGFLRVLRFPLSSKTNI